MCRLVPLRQADDWRPRGRQCARDAALARPPLRPAPRRAALGPDRHLHRDAGLRGRGARPPFPTPRQRGAARPGARPGRALGLSALGEARPLHGVVLSLAALAAIPVARLPLGWVFASLLAAFTIVLLAWPAVPALAALAPHPEGGGRFYGLTNTTETILLAPALVAGAALGPLWIGLLAAAATVAGVDGGGLVVVFAAFIVLALLLGRLYHAAALALVGATGALVLLLAGGDDRDLGSNHVTDAASGGAGGSSTR